MTSTREFAHPRASPSPCVRCRINRAARTRQLPEFDLRVLDDLSGVDAAQWNRLAPGHPLLSYEFFDALHSSACASADSGWLPQFLTLWDKAAPNGVSGPAVRQLRAAMPLYLKDHSYGEYVFDWAWADAYQRHGLPYYPKLLDAVPFTPVPGPRLLSRDASGRRLLLRAMQQFAREAGLSSAHLLFLDEADQDAARADGWMMRSTVQFHWTQRTPEPYADFTGFLASLQRDKRKKIQQECRRVVDAGVRFTELLGAQIGADDWDFFYRCYTQTYREHRSTPY